MNKKTVEQLLIHTTDTAVKPIIGNKEIEKTAELVYNQEGFKFEVVTPEKLTELIEGNTDNSDIPTLTSLYSAISTNGTVTEKLNILTYFESLIINSQIAN